jgi:hypothetical protein
MNYKLLHTTTSGSIRVKYPQNSFEDTHISLLYAKSKKHARSFISGAIVISGTIALNVTGRTIGGLSDFSNSNSREV